MFLGRKSFLMISLKIKLVTARYTWHRFSRNFFSVSCASLKDKATSLLLLLQRNFTSLCYNLTLLNLETARLYIDGSQGEKIAVSCAYKSCICTFYYSFFSSSSFNRSSIARPSFSSTCARSASTAALFLLHFCLLAWEQLCLLVHHANEWILWFDIFNKHCLLSSRSLLWSFLRMFSLWHFSFQAGKSAGCWRDGVASIYWQIISFLASAARWTLITMF